MEGKKKPLLASQLYIPSNFDFNKFSNESEVMKSEQMHRKHSVSSIVLGKDKFAVTVYPHVDYAFIVALVVILEEINEDRSNED